MLRERAPTCDIAFVTPRMSWDLISTWKYMAPGVRARAKLVELDPRARWIEPGGRDVAFIVHPTKLALLPGCVRATRAARSRSAAGRAGSCAVVVVVPAAEIARVEGKLAARSVLEGSETFLTPHSASFERSASCGVKKVSEPLFAQRYDRARSESRISVSSTSVGVGAAGGVGAAACWLRSVLMPFTRAKTASATIAKSITLLMRMPYFTAMPGSVPAAARSTTALSRSRHRRASCRAAAS